MWAPEPNLRAHQIHGKLARQCMTRRLVNSVGLPDSPSSVICMKEIPRRISVTSSLHRLSHISWEMGWLWLWRGGFTPLSPTPFYSRRKVSIVYSVPEFLCCRMIWFHPHPFPCEFAAPLSVFLLTVCTLYSSSTLACGGGVGGPKKYDSTESILPLRQLASGQIFT